MNFWFAFLLSLVNANSNWAVLVCTSRFWFNYRHIANTLSIYRTVKRLGIPDNQIILMLADDVACSPRNVFKAQVYNNINKQLDLYGESIEVDYRGYEVTVDNFLRVLTNRFEESVPLSKRLDSNENSNILVYMTGHGGNEFLKFQDHEEISSQDIADGIEQMSQQKRFKSLLFMVDTCQANTLYSKFYTRGVIATGSSEKGENSYSHHMDPEIGVAVIDRYTYYTLEFMEKVDKKSKKSLKDLFSAYDARYLHSTPGFRTDLWDGKMDDVLVTDFFGGSGNVEMSTEKLELPEGENITLPERSLKRGEKVESKLLKVERKITTFSNTALLGVGALLGLLFLLS